MSPSPQYPRQFPGNANLEYLKKEAKQLLGKLRSGDPDAVRRVERCNSRFSASGRSSPLRSRFSLQEAQFVLAREYGFDGWDAMREAVHVQKASARGYTDPTFWGRIYHSLRTIPNATDGFRDRWTDAFLEPLREAGACTVLDMGCGLGFEARRLAAEGFDVTGIDFAEDAIAFARSKEPPATFMVADMADPLPFDDGRFDAVMSNVAAHMFSDRVTRRIFAEVGRVLRSGGLFLFHLNSLEDRALRAAQKGPGRELAENFVLEQDGQTMHFFSREYLLELLHGWEIRDLVAVVVLQRESELRNIPASDGILIEELVGAGFEVAKKAWRGIAASP